MSYGATDWTTTYSVALPQRLRGKASQYPTPFGTLDLDTESFGDYTDDEEDRWDDLQWTDPQIEAFERRQDLNSLNGDEDESDDVEDYPEVEKNLPFACAVCNDENSEIVYSPDYGWNVCRGCREAMEEL